MNKTPYTSITETVARILALLITLLCFSIYILSKEIQLLVRLDWALLMVHLLVFWIAYEIFSFCFFLLLQQFAATKEFKLDQITSQSKPNLDLEATKLAEPNADFDKR
jgi:hypothetical protein